MLDVGAMLVYVADELICTATDLVVQSLALFFGLVDILDVAVVGGNTVSDEVVRARKDLLDLGGEVLKRLRVLDHIGRDAVDLFCALPLFSMHGTDESIHDLFAVSVEDRDRDDLVVIVKAGQLKVEEENAAAVHTVVCVSVRVALCAADSHFVLVAGLAELLLEADVLTAFDAHQRHTQSGHLVVEIYDLFVAAASESHGLLDHLKMHSGESFLGVVAEGCGTAERHTLDLGARFKLDGLLTRVGSVPKLGIRLCEFFGIKPENDASVFAFRIRRRCTVGSKMHELESSSVEIIFCLRLTVADLRHCSPAAQSDTFLQNQTSCFLIQKCTTQLVHIVFQILIISYILCIYNRKIKI